MGNEPRTLTWICDECKTPIQPTGQGDDVYLFYQCGTGHMFKRPRKRVYQRPAVKVRRGYTPGGNDAA